VTVSARPEARRDVPPRFRFTPQRLVWTIDRTQSIKLWDRIGVEGRRDGVVQFRFAGDDVWALTDPAWCRQALAAPNDAVARSGSFQKLAVFLGRSLLTLDGPEHRLRRRQMHPAFQRQRLEAYADSMVAAAEETAKSWVDGQQVAMEREMAGLTLDAIGRAVLGIDGRASADVVGGAIERLMRAMPLMFVPRFERVALRRLPGLGWLGDAYDVLDEVARTAATSSDAELVASLRELAADVPELSDEAVRDELLTLLLAGHETTAVTLSWAWWLLDRHPDVASRLRTELADVLGERRPSYADVDTLPFTQAVVAETLRLRPAAWIIERQVVGDIAFGEFVPPRGTLLLIPTWVLHHDPRWWRDPNGFHPDRWLDADGRYSEDAPGQPRGAYLPFGAGPHVCIGASFAWVEAVLALAVLAPQWRPSLVPGARIGMRASITLRPAHGMPMVLHAV
jgi:cytochrome P450